MSLYDRDDRMTRRKFLHDYGLEDATEKRARAGGLSWPPHKILGGRVFYSRKLVTDWFAQHDQSSDADRRRQILERPAVDAEVAQ